MDAYRYLWDGAAVVSGVDPYAYAPARVLAADPAREPLSEPLRRLVRLRDRGPVLRTILQRVHFAHLRTIYPPVSQAVFALSVWAAPRGASVRTRLLLLKAVIVLFDLGCVALLWRLLDGLGVHPGWTVLWAWSPLVLKEFAGSSHHDVIAVFFVVCALCVSCAERFDRWNAVARWTLAGTLLALGIGAKVFPVVLIPLFAVAAWRRSGWRGTVAVTNAAGFVGAALLLPMWAASAWRPVDAQPAMELVVSDAPPVPPSRAAADDAVRPAPSDGAAGRAPGPAEDDASRVAGRVARGSWQDDGLWAFLRFWEINDWAFRVLAENLGTHASPEEDAWYAVLPKSWRNRVAERMAAWWAVPPGRSGFVAARIVTAALTGVIVLMCCCRLYRDPRAVTLLAACGATLAWFWFLSPTQNPWYWSWALILLPFVPNRGWLSVAPLALLYYLRFWLAYHFAGQPLWGTPYRGAEFFDHVVVWFEHVPVLAAVALSAIANRRRTSGSASAPRECPS
ncbi:MAG: hypothetical protein D6725_06145 [Planctomycetota bacterium]|nr:MAG: hypothetical protein D6725_06145 [Planctomycetota bacterium]